MQIHLSKPGGQKEGPYTLEQINEALAARQFRGSDYWAWQAGLAEWVPLYAVPGVLEPADPEAGYDTQHLDASAIKRAESEQGSGTTPTTSEAPGTDRMSLASGMPFSALDQIFILTTGEGQTASRSAETAKILQEVIGIDWGTIRSVVPRDAISQCTQLEGIGQVAIPALIWRTLTAFKPELLQHAREGVHRICVRRFRIETGDLVAVFLFYNKQRLQ